MNPRDVLTLRGRALAGAPLLSFPTSAQKSATPFSRERIKERKILKTLIYEVIIVVAAQPATPKKLCNFGTMAPYTYCSNMIVQL